jgi:hypothetical protein
MRDVGGSPTTRLATSLRRSLTAIGLVAAAAVVGVGAGPTLAAARSAARAPAATAPTCTDSWVGLASRPLWTIGQNRSTGKVPGPTSDLHQLIATGLDGSEAVTTITVG